MDHLTPRPDLYGLPFTSDSFNSMPYRQMGRSGLRAASVGIGTWKMGYPETGDGSRTDEKTAHEIFDRAMEIGATFWDTANRYNSSSGNAERVIGTWMKANPDQRRNVVIATKMAGMMDGVSPNHCRLSRTNILESVYASLERMRIEHIDLLFFHAFDADTPIEESLSAIEDLVREDLVRYFGVSNFTVDQLTEYRAIEQHLSCRCRVIAVQNQFDILNGESAIRPGVLDFAAGNGLSFVAWSPLARGLLTERYLDASRVGQGDRLHDEGEWKTVASNPSLMDKVQRLAELAHACGWALNQLALAYMLSRPGMGPIIASVSSARQLDSNATAGRITLEEEQKTRIKEILEA
jgi:aryl-alcohol dehydrogenase-like predicted oxidoreductase